MIVPCNRCWQCLVRNMYQWKFRLMEEQKSSVSSFFCTLTYNETTVPKSRNGLLTLLKTDVQKFLKRLRKYQEKNYKDYPKIKYFLCGEYGTETMRPHYHAIFFNVHPEMTKIYNLFNEEQKGVRLVTENYRSNFVEIWGLGNVDIAPAEAGSIAYTVSYMLKSSKQDLFKNKKQLKLEALKEEDDREFEFRVMSNGIGTGYLTPEKIKYYNDKKIPFMVVEGGNKMAMPRYYKEKIYDEEALEEIAQKVEDFTKNNKKYTRKEREFLRTLTYKKINPRDYE